jgi:NADH-ubiquinone oxidoreductase chain 5
MFISMFLLAVASMFIGYLFSDLMLGSGQSFWQDSIYVLPCHFSFVDVEFIHPFIKNLPVLLSILAMYITLFFLNIIEIWSRTGVNLKWIYSKFLYPIWFIFASWSYHAGFFNTIYNYIFLQFFNLSYISMNKYLDKGLFEYWGPFGFYKMFRFLHKLFQYSWYSIIYFSLFFMCIALCVLLWYWIGILLLIHVSFINI